MNILLRESQPALITVLTEGCPIHAIERLTETPRGTIMRIGLTVGERCGRQHDNLVCDLRVIMLEVNQAWVLINN